MFSVKKKKKTPSPVAVAKSQSSPRDSQSTPKHKKQVLITIDTKKIKLIPDGTDCQMGSKV